MPVGEVGHSADNEYIEIRSSTELESWGSPLRIGIAFLLGLAVFSQLSCDDTVGVASGTMDITTMATPNGGKLKSAEEGPVRSALGQPDIELDSFRLSVSGLVDSGFSLSWDEIQEWPSFYSDTILMYCVDGWEVWGNWKGILVKDLLYEARLEENGAHVMFHSVDGYSTSLPVPYIEKYNALLAYEVNGNALADYDGFPLRLIAFGKFGYKWAKWVNWLEVVADPLLGFWESVGYDNRADVPMERRRYYEGPNAEPLDY
jgi:DMSO/TMAO reductase YedYZ molybdopterin-dependent catalytic subunit